MVRAQRRKYHYIYKITRFDGMYYIGMHSTDNLEDGYFGSGKRLWHSINYHGVDKHIKEILEFLPDRESLKLREKELVCKELLEDALCLNLKVGGEGGWNKQSSANGGKKTAGKTGIYHAIYLKEKEGYAEKVSKTIQDGLKKSKKWNAYLASDRSTHIKKLVEGANSEIAKSKRKLTNDQRNFQKAENNSQFGTCWVSNDVEVKKIKKDNLESYIAKGYQRGRKFIPS